MEPLFRPPVETDGRIGEGRYESARLSAERPGRGASFFVLPRPRRVQRLNWRCQRAIEERGLGGGLGGGAEAGCSTRYRVGTSDCDTRRRPEGHPSSRPEGGARCPGRPNTTEKMENKQTNKQINI